jgi:hypothetical protein
MGGELGCFCKSEKLTEMKIRGHTLDIRVCCAGSVPISGD